MGSDRVELKKMENEYQHKLKNYNHNQRILNDELNKYINNEDTSFKNKTHSGQNIFVTSLNGDIKPKSLGCHNVDINEWRKVDISSNENFASACKKYSIMNNEKYFGLQDFSNNQKCFVSKNNASIKKMSKHFSKLYWESTDLFKPFFDFFGASDPDANVLTLAYNNNIFNFNYDPSKKWLNKDGVKGQHATLGPAYTNKTHSKCNPFYGGTITSLNALYGNNCKNGFDQYVGQEQATKLISEELLHTNGKNLLINDDLLGNPCTNDLDKNVKKDIRIDYTCGINTYKIINAQENEHVNISCDELKNSCPPFNLDISKGSIPKGSTSLPSIMKLMDNGDICIYKSMGDTKSIWCLSSDSSNVEQILSVPKLKGVYKSGLESDSGFKQENNNFNIGGEKYSNTKWLKGRDYLNNGEPFQIGMLLASKSGTCCLRLNKHGKIQLFYSTQSCAKVDGNLYGERENILEISEFSNSNNLNNLGKMGYVIGYGKQKDQIRGYPDDLIGISNKFSDPIQNRNFDYKTGEAHTNVSLKKCKSKCLDMGDNCLGISWIDDTDQKHHMKYRKYDEKHGDSKNDKGNLGTCFYSHAKTYNKLFTATKYSKDTEFMYRLPEPLNNSSCGKKVFEITNEQWYNYELNKTILNDKMSKHDTCGMSLATERARHNTDIAYNELKQTVDKISDKLKNLTENEKKNFDKTGENLKKLQMGFKQFNEIRDNEEKNMNKFDNYAKIRESSEAILFESNNKYLFWCLLTISFVIIVLSINK